MKNFYPVTAIKAKLHDYKLRHLRIGKVKNLKKDGYTDFKIVNISWDVHWMTNLFLAVIIRDYLRFFIKNTPVIGNTAWEDISRMHKATPEENNAASVKWEAMVNSVADEFDEVARSLKEEDIEDWEAYYKEQKALIRKAFTDLADIFDELYW